MDDLIIRKAAISAAKHAWAKGLEPSQYIEIIPAVPAVPLDELCLLLHDIAGSPCYTQPGEDMCNQIIGDQCNPECDDAECWKKFLTKWMEGQDADRQ